MEHNTRLIQLVEAIFSISDTGCYGGRGQFFIRKNNTAGRHQK